MQEWSYYEAWSCKKKMKITEQSCLERTQVPINSKLKAI